MKVMLLLTAVVVSAGCAHTRQPERKIYVISERPGGAGSPEGPGIGGAGAEAYCNELQKKCHKQCKRRAPRYSGIKKGSPEHDQLCTTECLEEFMRCVEEQEALERQAQRRELRFPNIDSALSWLREHKTELAVGTVVVVAGVAFVVGTGGVGVLILVPLAL